MPTPMRTLQVAVTTAALLLAQAPAHAQGPAPAPPSSPPPAAAPAPAPTVPPAPPTDTRAPSQELPTEAQPLPPWQPTPEVTQPTPPPTDQPPPADQPPPSDVQTPLTGDGAETPAPPPAVGPEPPPAPVDTVKANKLRRAGSGVMITGGAIALAGFAMTLAFTLRGNKFEKDLITVEGNYSSEDCSRGGGGQCDALTAQRQETRDGIANSDRYTKISGGILAAGILVAAIGGIVYRRGMKQLGTANTARIRVSPTFGGLSLSGRF